MRLNWDEIRRRAKAFSEDWKDAHYEKGETHSFYNAFFEIFGVNRRAVAVYEKRVQSLDANKRGFIDLYWPGVLIVEQKSAGRDLLAASAQASTYFDWLPERDQPRYMLVCDFQRFRLTDLDDNGRETAFALADLYKHIEQFDFILGRRVTFTAQANVTVKAAELMGRLHDALEDSGYTGHDLEQLLVRLLFCLFADDTGIFQPKDIFLQLIDNDTAEDGSNAGRLLSELFDVLDTPEDQRQAGLSGELGAFPYVNGALFAGHVRTPVFDKKMRALLLDAAKHDWSGVSPAIFGSLFQSVMDAKERRAKGAHYTTETNILKVIGPLFLDDLRAELEKLKLRKNRNALIEFQHKLARLTFFDPACGCGNFLVVAYREIRRLELDCLKALYGKDAMDVRLLSQVTVGQFYGIEFEEFPARIAEVAMWMADHLAMNELNEAFGGNAANIPLKDSAHIRHGDALEVDWNDVIPAGKCHYIMGNPPFVGAKFQSEYQRAQVRRIANLGGSGGTLDYVAAWFIKAGQYLNGKSSPSLLGEGDHPQDGGGVATAQPSPSATPPPPRPAGAVPLPETSSGRISNPRIRIAFVATNSITQGEQVAQLWPILFDRCHLEIMFAHRTFSWGSEARGRAHVHVVIIGLTHRDNEPAEKRLFSYPDIKGDPVESRHAALTAYLFDAKGVANRHLVVAASHSEINGAPELRYGSQPIDGGHLIFDHLQRAEFLSKNPGLAAYVRPFIGSVEYINAGERWILALQDATPAEMRTSDVKAILERVRLFRLESSRPATRELSKSPSEFAFTTIPKTPFLVVPEVSSERRRYVPIGWLEPPTIPSNLVRALEHASLWHFGVLTSAMHMSWLGHVGGRLKSDFRYSNALVYNTFPWPVLRQAQDERGGNAQRGKIEMLAQAVLDARSLHTTSSLADLYDPDTMPPNLRKAHTALDSAVDRLYRPAPFASDRDRVEHLFGRYEALVNPLERIGIAKNMRVSRKGAKNVLVARKASAARQP